MEREAPASAPWSPMTRHKGKQHKNSKGKGREKEQQAQSTKDKAQSWARRRSKWTLGNVSLL